MVHNAWLVTIHGTLLVTMHCGILSTIQWVVSDFRQSIYIYIILNVRPAGSKLL